MYLLCFIICIDRVFKQPSLKRALSPLFFPLNSLCKVHKFPHSSSSTPFLHSRTYPPLLIPFQFMRLLHLLKGELLLGALIFGITVTSNTIVISLLLIIEITTMTRWAPTVLFVVPLQNGMTPLMVAKERGSRAALHVPVSYAFFSRPRACASCCSTSFSSWSIICL